VNRPKLQALSNEELAELFKQFSFKQADSEMRNDSRTYNRCFDRLKDISTELRQRGFDARRALVPLLDCPRDAGRLSDVAQCRYNAAWELLAVEPDRARATLKAIATSVTQYQMALARGTLERLDNGTFTPT